MSFFEIMSSGRNLFKDSVFVACQRKRFTKWYTSKWDEINGCDSFSFFIFLSFCSCRTLPWPYQESFIGEPLLTSLFAQTLISMISVRINNFFSCLALFTFFFSLTNQYHAWCVVLQPPPRPHAGARANISFIQLYLFLSKCQTHLFF